MQQQPWFERDSQWQNRSHAPSPRRTAEEIKLALSSLPMYQVVLTTTATERATLGERAHALVSFIGQERTAHALAIAQRRGAATLATCARELAEHYCDELARHGLPCVIMPA